MCEILILSSSLQIQFVISYVLPNKNLVFHLVFLDKGREIEGQIKHR